MTTNNLNFWNGKKVLVTGSEGFIGSHLTEALLASGASVRAFVLYNSFNRWGWLDTFTSEQLKALDIFVGDIRDSSNVYKAMEGIDTVFHLAALIAIPYSYYSPESYVATNVMGTLNVLQAARNHRIKKMIHTSTSETYGTAQYTPINESHPLQGQSPYSATKIGADMMAESYYRSFDLPVAIIRPFNTYGPRQSARAVIPTIISQIASGKKQIKLGDLTPVRDLNYVIDTVNGFLAVAESNRSIGEVINIGAGCGITIGDLAERIITLMASDASIVTDSQRIRPEKSEVRKLIADCRKAESLLGWKPLWSLEDGLHETIRFVQKNMDHYKTDIYNI